MYIPDFELHQPRSLEEAGELQDRYGTDARFLAGGTDVLVDLKTRRYEVGHLISLNAIDGLRGVTRAPDGVHIGALTTISQLNGDPTIREHLPAVLDASTQMATPQIRNAATVGGNLASAVPCADLPPILAVLNGSVLLESSAGQRVVSLDALFVGPRETTIQPGEVLTAAVLPELPRGFGAAYARFGLRRGGAVAVASVAASLLVAEDGTIRQARVWLGAVAPVPLPVQSASTLLVGSPARAEVFDRAAGAAAQTAQPITDVRGSADFRRDLVAVLTQRALQAACQRAGEVVA